MEELNCEPFSKIHSCHILFKPLYTYRVETRFYGDVIMRTVNMRDMSLFLFTVRSFYVKGFLYVLVDDKWHYCLTRSVIKSSLSDELHNRQPAEK